MTPAAKVAWIALAGAAGTLARYFLSGFVQRVAGGDFPAGTLAVNALGCLAFGFVWSLAEGRPAFSAEARTLVLVGFLGAFTTFSAFAFDTGQFLRESRYGLAFSYVAAQNGLGLVFLFIGAALGRLV